jgi:hypothetical protein
MVLHSLSLAVESIILGSFEGRLSGTRESALEGGADRWRAQLGREALGTSEHGSLREHIGVVVVQLLFGVQGTSSSLPAKTIRLSG